MDSVKRHTTISVSPETLKELAEICLKTQSYDDLLKELITMKKKVTAQNNSGGIADLFPTTTNTTAQKKKV